MLKEECASYAGLGQGSYQRCSGEATRRKYEGTCISHTCADGYEGDVEWEHNGEKCSTSRGCGAYDGCGATRSYGNKHKGNQAAFVVTSGVTKKPVALVHYQVSIVICLISTDDKTM